MGEAIARFRDMALSIRRVCDERHSQPRGREVEPAAAKKFAKACRGLFLEHEKAGMPYPARYVRGLCKLRDEAERHAIPAPPGHFDLPGYIEWLPEPFAAKEPGDSTARLARREAVREALLWGPLFPVVEARIKALDAAADMLLNFAAPECYQWPDEKYWKTVDGGQTVIKQPSKHDADRDYIAQHERFAEALEALAPFIEEPPAAAAASEEKTVSSRRPPAGGRPKKYSASLRQAIIADRKREERKKNPKPLKTWLTSWATGHGMKRADALKMYNAEMAAIRRAQQGRSR